MEKHRGKQIRRSLEATYRVFSRWQPDVRADLIGGMIEVTVLASGSSGNALLVRSGDCCVLVDAGLSARRLGACLESCGVAPGSLSGILLTDLGYATRQVVESVRGVHALLIETNHDEALLQNDTRRPWSVKQRILSRHGHLSNSAAAEIVAEVATDALRHVLLGHLSRDCNSPELAVLAVGSRLEAGGRQAVQVRCARADEEAPMLRLVV